MPMHRRLLRTAWLAMSIAVGVATATASTADTLPVANDPTCQAPLVLDDGWDLGTTAAAGFDAPALCRVLDDVAVTAPFVHGVVIERRGRLVAELYRTAPDRPITTLWGLVNPIPGDTAFGPQTLHDVRSVSKSLIGLLVGAMRQRGTVVDLHRPVLDFFPELADLRTPAREAITLDHLLTMTSGLAWEEGALPNDEHRMFWSGEPARLLLSRPSLDAPGTTWRYNGGGTMVVAEVLSRAAGQSFPDLVRTLLFEPMGITTAEWATDLRGRPMAFNGARMRPRDMAKIGRLVLDKGRWHGQALVAEEWVEAMLAPRAVTSGHWPTGEAVHYGHQWRVGRLVSRGRSLAWAGAFGHGGQRIVVLPALDLTVVITAGDYSSTAHILETARLVQRVVDTLPE